MFEYLDGTLDPRLESEIKAHLEECEYCKRELERCIKVNSLIGSVKEELPQNFKLGVMEKIYNIKERPNKTPFYITARKIGSVAAALFVVVSVGVGAHLAMKNKSVADSMNSAVDCADNVAVAEAQNESAKAYESSVMYGAPNKSSLSGSKVDETESVPEIEAEFRVETESEEYIIFHDSQNTTEEKELTTPSYKSAANESDKPEGEQSAPLVFDGITADTQEEIDDYAYAVTEAQTTDSNVFSQNETLIGVDDVKSSQEETAKAKETAKEDSDEKTAENEEVVLTGIPSSTDVTSVSESKTTGAGIYEIKGEGDCNSVSLKVVLPVFAFTVLLLIVILLLVRLVNLKKNNND